MKKIGLLSDSHSYLDPMVFDYFNACDEVWHAGDIGNEDIAAQLEVFKPFRAVYGNIDHGKIKNKYPLNLRFDCEGLDVFMTHIGGYPGRYSQRVRKIFDESPPKLYICGHSHILKIMPDKRLDLLHINPGACGHHGFHIMRTLVRFEIENAKIQNCEVIELGKRGR